MKVENARNVLSKGYEFGTIVRMDTSRRTYLSGYFSGIVADIIEALAT